MKLKIVGPQGDLYMLGNCNDTWKLIRIPILEIFFLFHIMCSPTEWIFMTRLRQTVRQHVMASWFCLSSFCLLICRKLELGMVTWKYDHRKYYGDKVCDHSKLILLLGRTCWKILCNPFMFNRFFVMICLSKENRL